MSKTFIVKIQRSQYPSPKWGLLIYDESNEHFLMFWKHDAPEKYRELSKLMGSMQKCYAYAHFNKAGLLIIDVTKGVAPWQEW